MTPTHNLTTNFKPWGMAVIFCQTLVQTKIDGLSYFLHIFMVHRGRIPQTLAIHWQFWFFGACFYSTIEWIALKIDTYIHCTQRMICNDFGDPPTVPVAPPDGQSFHSFSEISQKSTDVSLWQIPARLLSYLLFRMVLAKVTKCIINHYVVFFGKSVISIWTLSSSC